MSLPLIQERNAPWGFLREKERMSHKANISTPLSGDLRSQTPLPGVQFQPGPGSGHCGESSGLALQSGSGLSAHVSPGAASS